MFMLAYNCILPKESCCALHSADVHCWPGARARPQLTTAVRVSSNAAAQKQINSANKPSIQVPA
jgi:hypothetical protein